MLLLKSSFSYWLVSRENFTIAVLTSYQSSAINFFIIRQAYLLLKFVHENSKFSIVRRIVSVHKQVLQNIIKNFNHISSEKDSILIDWVLDQRSFNFAIRAVIRKITDFAKWIEKRRKIYEQNKSLSTSDYFAEISRISTITKFTTFEISLKIKNHSKNS